MIHQLRIYEIFERNKAAFHARFRDHAARIMQRYGFQIIAMWETKTDQRTEFVYLLTWLDEAAKSRAWAAFMADEEWKEITAVGIINELSSWPFHNRNGSSSSGHPAP